MVNHVLHGGPDGQAIWGIGLIPIGGSDIWLHATLGIVLAGIGFTAKEEMAGSAATA